MLVSFLFFAFFVFCSFFTKYLRDKIEYPKSSFSANFRYELSVYLTEISFVFLIFQSLLYFFAEPLGYQDEGFLKRFIDLFTIYQIFIFVVLKLYDSHKKDAYSLVVFTIDLIEPYVDRRVAIPKGFSIIKDKKFITSSPPKVMILLGNLYDFINEYEVLRSGDSPEEIKELERVIYEIKKIRIGCLSSIDQKELQWNISLLLRFIKIPK